MAKAKHAEPAQPERKSAEQFAADESHVTLAVAAGSGPPLARTDLPPYAQAPVTDDPESGDGDDF